MIYLILLIVTGVALWQALEANRRSNLLARRVAELEQTVVGLGAEGRPRPADPSATAGTGEPGAAPGTWPEGPATAPPAESRSWPEGAPPTPAPEGATPPAPNAEAPGDAVAAGAAGEPEAGTPPHPSAADADTGAAGSADNGAGPPREPALAAAFRSLRERWLIWVAALSLAFGAVFLVQYGIEKGLLGPAARVAGAALLGVGLIAAAERIRPRSGERFFLDPSAALAAGGVSALFTAAFAAHFLYGLTGPILGFLTMAGASGAAILYGLRQGPVLAVIGVLGAYVTPLLVQGHGTPLVYLYILTVALAALAIERWRHWTWLSAAAMALAFAWGFGIFVDQGPDPWLACYLLVLAALAVGVPAFGLPPATPEHTMTTEMLVGRQSFLYPTVLASVSLGVAMAELVVTAPAGVVSAQAALLAGPVLIAAGVLGCRRAENLDDGVLLAALIFLAVAAVVGWASFPDLPGDQHLGRGQEVTPGDLRLIGWGAGGLIAAALVVFGGGLIRVETGSRPALWSAAAAVYPPAALVVFYLVWGGRTGFSDALWGVIAALVAVPMVLAAGRFRRAARAMELPAGLLALGAIGLVALAAGFALTGAPLTIAFAVIALAAVMLDRRFDMALLALAAQAAAVLATGRLVLLPGLPFALESDWQTLWLAFAPTILLLAAASRVAEARARRTTRAVLESAAISLLAIFISVLLIRWLDGWKTLLALAGLVTLAWGALALAQGWRARAGGPLAGVRRWLGWAYAAVAGVALLLSLSVFNPLVGPRVVGPPLIDSMTLAYLLPGLALLATPRLLHIPPGWRRWTPQIGGALLGALWLALEIRRFWRGVDLSVPGVTNAELYSYTVAMLLATVATILAGHLAGSRMLRTAGTALAAVTAIKVFAVDMAGLVGLARAASFIGLGLALAGIGWLHGRLSEPEPERA